MRFDPNSFSLSGRNAVVIGGAGAIGLAIAQAFQASGARVILAGRSREKLERAVNELSHEGASAHSYPVDARAPDDLKALADQIEVDHGPVDILVNCQGTTAIKPALELSEEEYDTILDTNLKSVFFACTAFGKHMVQRGAGRIINITSLASHTGWANAVAYSASKWGVAGVTQTLAAEWGEQGVRVNAIAPGFFLTELNRDRMSETRKAEARSRNAMKRMGEVDELAGAAVYLASDASGFVSGATLRVDGGYLSSGI
ncbi:SDR family NAD(P)-dependent oxidoreductase [Fodinicurvata sediminis]|uniref:SDR family NAD(P)-dependent oxidoreductase n=1 Tax=Fodinicurvata sediminis TaxID=1121832 RepID=UPI0003B6D0CB|nr:SDR family oxidoreductase [Fodinicurvata sediminis]